MNRLEKINKEKENRKGWCWGWVGESIVVGRRRIFEGWSRRRMGKWVRGWRELELQSFSLSFEMGIWGEVAMWSGSNQLRVDVIEKRMGATRSTMFEGLFGFGVEKGWLWVLVVGNGFGGIGDGEEEGEE
ncbi:hypothetical protein ACE6H2_014215 [Prunus campanulata]